MAAEELIDIYDENGTRTGEVIARKGSFLKEGQFMLYVLAIIENGEGKILITRRSEDKRWAAGWWEVSGGGVAAGESSAEGIVREVREETGLDISGLDLHPVYRYSNIDLERGDNYLVDIYHVHMDFDLDDVTVQEREATAALLASPAEIEQFAKQGIFLHYERLKQALAAERGQQVPAV